METKYIVGLPFVCWSDTKLAGSGGRVCADFVAPKSGIILTSPWTLIMKVLSEDSVCLATDPPLALHVVSLLL